MKKHLQVQRLGQAEPLCGRQIARPGPGQQIAPTALTADHSDVRCGWCLQKMFDTGMRLTETQWPLVAKRSIPGSRDPEAEAEAEAEDEGPLPDEEDEDE